MHKCYIDMLECPVCHGELKWDIKDESETRVINAKITCSKCGAEYEVRDEIAVFLTPDLPRNDLWEKADDEIRKYFKENPDIFNKLMNTPEDELNGADYFIKMMYFEEKKDYKISSSMYATAMKKLYTKDYIKGINSPIKYIINNVKKTNCHVVDIASGRGYLVEEILKNTDNFIAVTDFSPVVLKRDKEYFSSKGLYDKVSLIAFDARRTPFKNNSIEIMTSNLGIQNIENPGNVISEMNRICGGKFMSIMHFVDKEDKVNIDMLKKHSIADNFVKEDSVNIFKNAGFQVEIQNSYFADIKPTPAGEIIKGAQNDAFPAADTKAEFCVLEGSK